MNKNASCRIVLDVIVFVSVLLGWWFVAIPLAIVGAWSFPKYAELVIAGFMYDALFSIGHAPGLLGYAFTIVTALLLAGMSYFKLVVKNNT